MMFFMSCIVEEQASLISLADMAVTLLQQRYI